MKPIFKRMIRQKVRDEGWWRKMKKSERDGTIADVGAKSSTGSSESSMESFSESQIWDWFGMTADWPEDMLVNKGTLQIDLSQRTKPPLTLYPSIFIVLN